MRDCKIKKNLYVINDNAKAFSLLRRGFLSWIRVGSRDIPATMPFPHLRVAQYGQYKTFVGQMIRQDWLDELGLQQSETIDNELNALGNHVRAQSGKKINEAFARILLDDMAYLMK